MKVEHPPIMLVPKKATRQNFLRIGGDIHLASGDTSTPLELAKRIGIAELFKKPENFKAHTSFADVGVLVISKDIYNTTILEVEGSGLFPALPSKCRTRCPREETQDYVNKLFPDTIVYSRHESTQLLL